MGYKFNRAIFLISEKYIKNLKRKRITKNIIHYFLFDLKKKYNLDEKSERRRGKK